MDHTCIKLEPHIDHESYESHIDHANYESHIDHIIMLSLLCVQELKFLGIEFFSGHNFNWKLQVNKHNFFRAANCILGRVGSKHFTNVTL